VEAGKNTNIVMDVMRFNEWIGAGWLDSQCPFSMWKSRFMLSLFTVKVIRQIILLIVPVESVINKKERENEKRY